MAYILEDPRMVAAEAEEARYWEADRECGYGWEVLADRDRFLTTGDFPVAEAEEAEEEAWAAWLEDTFSEEVEDR